MKKDSKNNELHQALRNVSPERQALLALQLKKGNKPGPSKLTISRLPRGDRDCRFPLSSAQWQLWLFEQVVPGSPVYNLPGAYYLEGALNRTALEETLREIFRRHEVLRTTYIVKEGEPVQVIGQSPAFIIGMVDLQSLSEARRKIESDCLIKEQSRQPFDLGAGPMLRATLLRLGEGEYVLILTGHHIAFDGWSSEILKKEMSLLYAAFSGKRPSPLVDLSIQYVDYDHWKTQRLQNGEFDAQLEYWKGQLAGLPVATGVPANFPSSSSHSFDGASRSLTIPSDLGLALKGLSQQQQVTLFITLLAGLNSFIYRFAGIEDFAVGTGAAGRTCAESEPIIGLFVNTLALRVDLSGNPSFNELVKRVREVVLDGYAHQDVPYSKIVEKLFPAINQTQTHLFQIMFLLSTAETKELCFEGLRTRTLPVENDTTKHDLTMSIVEGEQTLAATIEYRTDLFEATTIERVLNHFQTHLQGIVANPGHRISDLPLLMAAEREQLLYKWNETRASYPSQACIHEIFEERVEMNKEAIALVCEQKVINYRELNQRSNQLACWLRRRGVGPEIRVGICLERGVEMVVGLLGILKAGGVYVPLDPASPSARLDYMIRDAGVKILMTEQSLSRHVPFEKVLHLDTDWSEVAVESDENLPPLVCGENLAYVTYTSGSTGEPKGVSVCQRSVVRLVRGVDYVRLGPDVRLLQMAPLAFDASTFEIWGALLWGGTLVAMRERVPVAGEIKRLIRSHQATTLFITTALLNAVVDEDVTAFSGLKQLLTGGEAISERHASRAVSELNGAEIIHVYGPTESTTFALSYPIGAVERGRKIPIGRPISNTTAYVLDKRQEVAPVGVIGELYLGGDGLARGYLNRPEQTAERFLPNPFSDRVGERMYRTGDVVRYCDDGQLEFIGRYDHQVKLRGFRIELGEIEAALMSSPAIEQAAVVLAEHLPGEKRLMAYIVPKNEYEIESLELKQWLRERLPDYMVPATIATIERMPLTSNGKADRQALRNLGAACDEKRRNYTQPRTHLETLLAKIWSEALGIDQIGVFDNFFDLGGNSLAATRVMTKVRQAYRTELSLRSFFESPTIASLTLAIARSQIEQIGLEESICLLEDIEMLLPADPNPSLSDE